MTTPRKAAAKKAAAPTPTPDEKPDETADFAQAKVTVTPAEEQVGADHAAAEKRRLGKEARERAAAVRAGHVQGLENELAYLERQPEARRNDARISQVKAELDRYSDEPADAEIETA